MLKAAEVLNEVIQNPPTEAELALAAQLQAKAKRIFEIKYWATYAVLFAILIGTAAFFVYQNQDLAAVLASLMTACLICIFAPSNGAAPNWENFAPIERSACENAYNLFSATSEGLRYLEQIRIMGRLVTGFDLSAARSWNQVIEKRAEEKAALAREVAEVNACRRLYGVAA